MGLLGSSASVKDQRIRATAMYTDLKSDGSIETKHFEVTLSTHRLATCNPGHALRYVQRKSSEIKNRYLPSSKTKSEQLRVLFDFPVCTDPSLGIEYLGIGVDRGVTPDAPESRGKRLYNKSGVH
jgi:hypothetical protein